MREAILNFNKQFSYKADIENGELLVKTSSYLVIGMGGSALASKILKTWNPDLDIVTQSDYSLPEFSAEERKNKLVILSSYSGNTEEVVDAFKKTRERKLNIAVVAVGGELLKLAIEHKVPYIKLPETGIQPRMALGFSVIALLELLGKKDELLKIRSLVDILKPALLEEEGKKMAEALRDSIPVIYTSSRNLSIAYNWKIKFNETGKTPAFYNVFPELNHNEMTGFDVQDATRGLSDKFYFIILKDRQDDPRISKRMEVLEKLYQDRNLKIKTIELSGEDVWHKIFSSLLLADWAALYTAEGYGVESEQVPLVEEFKKLISN